MKQYIKKTERFLILVIISILMPTCGTVKKEIMFKNDSTSLQVNHDICPSNGTCSIAIKKGSYTIETDTIGAMYPLFTEGDGEMVSFTYHVPAKEGVVDGDYSETIMFLIPEDFIGLMVLEDESLSTVKLLLNKQCFCRGQAGYRLITKGRLTIERSTTNKISFDLSYELPGIDTVVSSIKL
jgi:hypothetical protein